MSQRTASLLSHCPICGRGEIIARSRKLLIRNQQQVLPCSACGATVTPTGSGSFKLSYCAPHRLGEQGCRRCAGYFYSMCFLDRALPLSDWQRMAQRKHPLEVEEFLARSRRLRAGELPTIEVPNLSAELAPGEVLHHHSYPVFIEDWYLTGASEDGGELLVTNRRLLYCDDRKCSSLPYEDFERIRRAYPGFYVKLQGEQEAHHFFTPSLDPVYFAVAGALKNFRESLYR